MFANIGQRGADCFSAIANARQDNRINR